MVSSHSTSLAIWGVATPVAVGVTFGVKVGVKCALGCRLAGQRVVVRDEAGATMGEGPLGDAPAPDTLGLFVAELTVRAPSEEGLCRWTAVFQGQKTPQPHIDASATFSFRASSPPEHTVLVDVAERGAGEPVANAAVFVGPYHAMTDACGRVTLQLPGGDYTLAVRKPRYEAHSVQVAVRRDDAVRVELVAAPEVNPDEGEVWM